MPKKELEILVWIKHFVRQMVPHHQIKFPSNNDDDDDDGEFKSDLDEES
jgi:hypothetical protein